MQQASFFVICKYLYFVDLLLLMALQRTRQHREPFSLKLSTKLRYT